MRGLLITFGLILALIAATFLPQAKDYRAKKSYEYFEQGNLKTAKLLYFYGKLQGDLKAANNYHVLDYRQTRYNDKASDKKKTSNRRKSFRAFDKLTQKGYVPAAYNAGMFYYRRKAGSEDYLNGLKYFDFAAEAGDDMSRYAGDMMRARQHKKERKYQAFREAADRENGYAAYRYAKNLRFDKKKLRYAEKYALMGAEAGYADAQEFLASYFPRRRDRKEWLEKAAMNSENRSLRAAKKLAELAKEERDHVARRKWLKLASTPREKFIHLPIVESEEMRWRGLQNTIIADANTTQSSAYELALMQMDGVGGEVDIAGAIKSLKYANDWSDARLLLSQVQAGNVNAGKTNNRNVNEGQSTRTKASKKAVNADLEKFDTHKNYSFHEEIRPYIKRKQIRYATHLDLKKYSNGVSTRYDNKKKTFKSSGRVEDCAESYKCFYMEKPIILPEGMSGANSAIFVINPALFMPEQPKSHNKYIFLNERYIP